MEIINHFGKPYTSLTSISGGKSSAYCAVNYPTDLNVFALVETENANYKWMLGKDESTRKIISDRIGHEFIGTAEMDVIIYTVLDLEQLLGKKIDIVTSLTFEAMVRNHNGYLPSLYRRFCTTEFKVEPIFKHLKALDSFPVETSFGYRLGEESRKASMLAKANADGLTGYLYRTSQKPNSRYWNRCNEFFQKPKFPLIDDRVDKYAVEMFWKNGPVRFARFNNCVGCVNRSLPVLAHVCQIDRPKMQLFKDLEVYASGLRGKKAYFHKGEFVDKALKSRDFNLFDHDFSSCDTGYCGV